MKIFTRFLLLAGVLMMAGLAFLIHVYNVESTAGTVDAMKNEAILFEGAGDNYYCISTGLPESDGLLENFRNRVYLSAKASILQKMGYGIAGLNGESPSYGNIHRLKALCNSYKSARIFEEANFYVAG